MDEATVANCLSEVKAALAGLEAATQASLRSSESRLHEAQKRATREVAEACQSAEEQGHQHAQRVEDAESRIARLEDKLQAKRTEISSLRELVKRMKEKLERKSEELLAIGDQDAGERKATAAEAGKAEGPAQPAEQREESLSSDEKGKEKRREGGRRRPASAQRRAAGGQSSSAEDGGEGASDSEDSSVDGQDERRPHGAKDKRRRPSRSRRSVRRDRSSRSREEAPRGQRAPGRSRSRDHGRGEARSREQDSRAGLPEHVGHQIRNDIEQLGMALAEMFPTAEKLIAKLEVFGDNYCSRWHQDNIVGRAIVSYNLCGTHYVNHEHVNLWELTHCGENSHIIRDTSQVCAVNVADMLFMKGKLFPHDVNGLVHKAPEKRCHDDGAVMNRLCLKVDVRSLP